MMTSDFWRILRGFIFVFALRRRRICEVFWWPIWILARRDDIAIRIVHLLVLTGPQCIRSLVVLSHRRGQQVTTPFLWQFFLHRSTFHLNIFLQLIQHALKFLFHSMRILHIFSPQRSDLRRLVHKRAAFDTAHAGFDIDLPRRRRRWRAWETFSSRARRRCHLY